MKMKYRWELTSFDTKLFGFKTAKIIDAEEGSVENLIDELRRHEIQYATFRVSANAFPLIHELEKTGFILVDGLINLEVKLDDVQSQEANGNIRKATKADLPHLRRLADGAFCLTRFYNDPFIPKEKADELYVKWIENSVLGDMADLVLVWEENEKILGFITLKKKGLPKVRRGHIPLIAVAPTAQRRGIAKRLIVAAFSQFKKWRIDIIGVETQMQNIPALRVYQACGVKIVNSRLTFSWHK